MMNTYSFNDLSIKENMFYIKPSETSLHIIRQVAYGFLNANKGLRVWQ